MGPNNSRRREQATSVLKNSNSFEVSQVLQILAGAGFLAIRDSGFCVTLASSWRAFYVLNEYQMRKDFLFRSGVGTRAWRSRTTWCSLKYYFAVAKCACLHCESILTSLFCICLKIRGVRKYCACRSQLLLGSLCKHTEMLKMLASAGFHTLSVS